jgi:RNA polymerase sigma factor (sigma-70 family)
MVRSDAELVIACRNGDEAAWAEFVQRYERLIYAIPLRAGLSADDAAEIFQRTFVLLLEHIGRIEQPERIGAWLVTTTRRECWRLQRRVRALPTQTLTGDDEAVLDIPDPDLLPEATLLLLEQQHLVRQALAALDPRCRNLLHILFYRDTPPPYAEIAATLEISEGSIGPTRARCLQKLRQQFELLDK